MLGMYLKNEIFLKALIVLSTLEVVSLLAYTVPEVNSVLLPVFTFIILFIFWRYPAWLVYLPLLEIVWGSLGRIFYWELFGFSLSIRMLIFGLSICVWLLKRPNFQQLPWSNILFRLYLLTLLIIVWGMAQGLMHGYNPSIIFADANGYFYLGYVLIWLTATFRLSWPLIISTTVAAATIVSLKTLFIFHIFTHAYSWANIGFLYLWIRDTKVGELTLVTANYWRIFFQSQIYPSMFWLATTVYLIFKPTAVISQKIFWLMVLFFSSIILSLSRSFWLALAVTICLTVIIAVIFIWKQPRKMKRLWLIFGSCLSTLAVIVIFLFVPPVDTDLAAALANRLGRGEAAVTSRANLLPVMVDGIKKNWLTGAGLGAELTYRNTDPRVRDQAGVNSLYTTHAFEFGWLDFWFKFGIVGFLAWVALIGSLVLRLLKIARFKAQERPLIVAAAALVVFIAITHGVTPYLNHPLGLGLIALVITSLLMYEQSTAKSHH
mgnify:CR=1 FL=1